jgi:hypothetical protein
MLRSPRRTFRFKLSKLISRQSLHPLSSKPRVLLKSEGSPALLLTRSQALIQRRALLKQSRLGFLGAGRASLVRLTSSNSDDESTVADSLPKDLNDCYISGIVVLS